ncbi:hypothetical protein Ancab_036944 [Ancistrocladus abbreviatus]
MEGSDGGRMVAVKAVRRGIWVVIMVVCAGYLMMWIMMPTMVYWTTWFPNMRLTLNSTFFGFQGSNLLVDTFPVLFIAVAACLYLHLGKTMPSNNGEERASRGKKKRLEGWMRRPMIVKGPLGLLCLSRMEGLFVVMFAGLVVWSLSTFLHVGFSLISPSQIDGDGGALWKTKLEIVAWKLGLAGNICLSFLFFPVARGSSVLPLFGLTSEASIKYHMWLGHLTMLLFTAHGACYLLLWGVTNRISHEVLNWQHVGIANVPGEVALIAGLCLWATTLPPIRRKLFELFFYTHHLYILFVFFFFLHVGVSFMCIMLPGFYLFMIDRLLRFLQSRRRVRLVSARILPSEFVELNFSKTSGLSYTPTSILFINVPSISKLQWHPFTITSSSSLESQTLSVLIKVRGNWTTKLSQVLASSPVDRLEVAVEGPYGPASTHFLRHDTLVMVSGGSGVTPFFSVIKELIYLSTTMKCKIPKLLLICVFKNSSDLTMLDLLLPFSSTPPDLSTVQLQIEAFVTREKELERQNLTPLQTVWFKPSASDQPISPILGRDGWLWLAAIISSSFTGFLLSIGILTRYYIYPIDHNTEEIFWSSKRVVLNVLLMCVCIVLASSGAVLWNKTRNGMEAKQIINMEGITPRGSPYSWSYNAERELESLPHESLVHSTNVHYCKRPDLKRLLSNCEGSSTGVLVSGPKKLRQEVAAICSSGLVENLHFESISFSW